MYEKNTSTRKVKGKEESLIIIRTPVDMTNPTISMKFSSQMTCHVFVVVFASKMYSPRGHPMTMQFYSLYIPYGVHTQLLR